MPDAEKDAGRIDALRIESDDGALTFATRHDGQIEAQTSGERVVFDREAVVRLADWLTKRDPDAEEDASDEALCPGCGTFHPTTTLGGRWGMCPPCDESTRPPGGSDA